MTYNVHPIFVHIPIALLFLYSVIKILPFERWLSRFHWQDIRRVMLAIGVIAAFFALETGETAEHLARPNHQLVEMHAAFAAIATWIYGALLLGEVAALVNSVAPSWLTGRKKSLVAFLEKTLNHPVLSRILALCALVAIIVTGLLGGVIVYGVTADPFAQTVLNILHITL